MKSRDPVTGRESAKTVTATIQRLASSVVRVSVTDAKTGQSETLTCTPEHPLFVQGQGWVEAGSLGIGSSIVSRAGPLLSVQSVTWQREVAGTTSSTDSKPYTVYNLTVEDDHTYFVGSLGGGTWVHNTRCGGVYKLLDEEGNVMRTGRTKDLAQREVQHQKTYPDLEFKPIAETDDYATQRGVEQMAHEQYEPPLNRIKGIRDNNPRRQEYMDAGQKYMDDQGLGW